jgi:hypothetical protein
VNQHPPVHREGCTGGCFCSLLLWPVARLPETHLPPKMEKKTSGWPSTFVHNVAQSTFQELNWSASATDFDLSTQMIMPKPNFDLISVHIGQCLLGP